MTKYVTDIVDQWESSLIQRYPGRRQMLYSIPDGTVPKDTLDRIVKCFGFPSILETEAYRLIDYLNAEDPDIDKNLKVKYDPNDLKEKLFRIEFVLTQLLYNYMNIYIEKKPSSQDIKRHLKTLKKSLLISLKEIQSNIIIKDRYTRAVLLSSLGKDFVFLDKNISSLIDDVKKAEIKNYRGNSISTHNRQGAVLSLAHSYYLCFGVLPPITDGSKFYQYLDVFFDHYDPDKVPNDLMYLIRTGVETLREKLNIVKL
jgi:hypothetical protein